MAPEQLAGTAVGPATDLYGLGCTVWALATGSLPFTGRDLLTLQAQKCGPLPPFTPAGLLPAHLSGWLARLLQPDAHARFSRAEQARRALVELDAPDLPPCPPMHPEHPRVAPPERAFLLHRRRPAVVGRAHQQALLWRALRRAHSGRATRVRLVGAAGVGKSRLAEWLYETGHALGLVARRGRVPELRTDTERVQVWVDVAGASCLVDQHPAACILVIETARSGDGAVVAPLEQPALRELARRELGLHAELAASLAELAGGSPRFVVAAARLDARLGNLVASPGGLRRAPEAAEALPPDVDAVARRWLESVVGPLQGDVLTRMRVTARAEVFSGSAWRGACAEAEVEPRTEALDPLAAAGVLRSAGANRWRWAAPWVAEAVRGGLS